MYIYINILLSDYIVVCHIIVCIVLLKRGGLQVSTELGSTCLIVSYVKIIISKTQATADAPNLPTKILPSRTR